MLSATQLLHAVLDRVVRQPDQALQLFSEDGVYEAPYLESLGRPWRYRGREEIGWFLDAHRALFPQLEFQDIVIVAETPDSVVAEYQYTARSTRTTRMIHQLIVGRLESSDGRITLLRESVNLVELALALYRDGLAGYRVPPDRSTWLDP